MIKFLPFRSLTSFKANKNVLYWFAFDCDGCKKKIKNPECKACEKMINYFNVFSMYPLFDKAQRSTKLMSDKFPQRRVSCRSSSTQTKTPTEKNPQRLLNTQHT